jgi:hypothetical protein
MGQVIDLQDWRRHHPADAAKATDLSPLRRAPQFFWAEPMLLSSLTVWRTAAVMWAGLVLGQRASSASRRQARARSGAGS